MSIATSWVIPDYRTDIVTDVKSLPADTVSQLLTLQHQLDIDQLALVSQHYNVRMSKPPKPTALTCDLAVLVYYKHTVVGFTFIRTNVDEIGGPCASITDIYVTPAQRGKGIAKVMLTDTFTLLKQQKIKGCFIAAIASNKNALALYRRFGFVDAHINLFRTV